jgi:hypothetical protein
VPWPVYSERFILSKTGGAYVVYTVPFERRLVATTFTFASNGLQDSGMQVEIGTFVVMLFRLPAAERFRSVTTRLVLYGGETLRMYNEHSGGTVSAHGYLFSSASAASDEPPDVSYDPYLEVNQLPADPR